MKPWEGTLLPWVDLDFARVVMFLSLFCSIENGGQTQVSTVSTQSVCAIVAVATTF